MSQPLCWVLGAGCWVLEQDGEQGRLDPSQHLPCAMWEIRHQTKEYGIANLVCPTKWFSTISYFLKWNCLHIPQFRKILSDNFLSKNYNYQSEFLTNKRSHSHPTVKITAQTGENDIGLSYQTPWWVNAQFPAGFCFCVCVGGGGGSICFWLLELI